MTHVTDDLELYAVNALTAEEAARVAVHVAECAACRTAGEAIAAVVDALPEAIPEREPPAKLRERILASARAEAARAARPRFALPAPLRSRRVAVAALTAAVAVLALVDLRMGSDLAATSREEARVASIQQRMRAAGRSWYMAGSEGWTGSGGTLVVPANGERPFVVFHNLRPLAQGQYYTVWLVSPDGARWARAATFRPDGHDLQAVDIDEAVGGYGSCRVTVETAVGGPPAGPVVMQSRIAPSAP